MHGRPLLFRLRCLLTTYATSPWLPGSTLTTSSATKTRLYASHFTFKWKRWEEHERETIKKGLAENLTYEEIAKLVPGRTETALRKFALNQRLYNLAYQHPKKRAWSTHEKETVMRGHAEGLTLREIAKLLPDRDDYADVYRFIHWQGLPLRRPPWNTHEKETVMRGHADGLTIAEIAELLPGRTIVAVRDHIRKHHRTWETHETETAIKGTLFKTHEVETIRKGIAEGLSHEKIAKLLPGRTANGVRKYASHHGLVSRRLRKWTAHELETAIKAKAEGLSYREIAKLLPGRTASAISAYTFKSGHSTKRTNFTYWKTHEIETIKKARAEGLKTFEIVKLLPGRTRYAVSQTSRLSNFFIA